MSAQRRTIDLRLRLGDTYVTHPELHTAEHPHDSFDPTDDPRACAYDHIHVLMEHLKGQVYKPALDLSEHALHDLERVEQ